MDYCRETIEAVVQTMKKILKNYTDEYDNAIEGSLICNYNQNGNRFYCARKENGKLIRSYLSPLQESGQKTLKQLARKEYLRRMITMTQKNLETLETAMRKYQHLDPSAMIKGMKRAYRMLDSTWFFDKDREMIGNVLSGELQNNSSFLGTCEDFQQLGDSKILLHKSWAEAPYEKNPYPFGEDEIYTSDGTRMRSKAEGMIYECLKKFNVPFRYDALINIEGPDGMLYEFAPDFSFEDSNREEFYWEFCGMMDDEEYVERYYIKRRNYEKAEIVPWKNMIYSYSVGNHIDMAYIESVIRTQIIPRL